jgi:hypothetical protein
MAVELKRGSKDPTLSLFYHFEKKEQLENISNTIYAFADTTSSKITLRENVYKPVRIHLTTVLHKIQKSQKHDYELIVEHHGQNEKLFLCFALKKKHSELPFPLIESPLEKITYKCSNISSLYYKTSTKSHVFLFASEIYVGDDFPKVFDNAKVKYKEIFEPNAFDIFSNLFTRNDLKMKVLPAVEGGQFTFSINNQKMEGFRVNPNPISSFMECELMEDEKGATIKTSEYALTPLNANYYERGIVTIVTFMHFLLIVAVGGIGLPYFQCNAYPTDKNKLWMWFLFFTLLQWSFCIVAIILLSIGLSGGQKRTQPVAGNTIKKKRLTATFGLYFLILFLSNALSMRIMFPMSDIYDPAQREERFQLGNILFYPMFHMTGIGRGVWFYPESDDEIWNKFINAS